MNMRTELATAVASLVGLPLWSSGRAADLQWFAFGDRRTITTSNGKEREVGEFALHVQCPWRIVCDDKIVVGSADLHYPADETAEVPEDDWDGVVTRRDRRVSALFESGRRFFTVKQVDVGDAGALRIALDEGYALEIFPQSSVNNEDWRLFRPYLDEPQVVVSGIGIEPDDVGPG
jgi:hypothetical protein